MTRTHKIILVIYALLILSGAAIPYVFCWTDELKWSLEIIRTTSILSASILALFYFDPFGIRKSNLAKQHENVIQILERTFAQRIRIDSQSNNPDVGFSKMFSQHVMTLEHIKWVLNDPMGYVDFPILIDLENFIEGSKELVELKNSLFTPKSVSEKMKFLEFSSASKTGTEYESYSIVSWSGQMKKEMENLCDEINQEKLTVRQLLINYQGIINECISWLETNSFSTKNLNIK